MLEATKTKLEEAKFFNGLLRNEQNKPPGHLAAAQPNKAFLFYLSAFMSAARSIPWVMQNEDKEKYDKWLREWENTLTKDDRDLLKFTNAVRIDVVKRQGAATEVEWGLVPAESVYTDKSFHPAYGFHFMGSSFQGTARVGVQIHHFEIGGQKVAVTDVCDRYIEYNERMIADFIENLSINSLSL
jgi:hypothetical protein